MDGLEDFLVSFWGKRPFFRCENVSFRECKTLKKHASLPSPYENGDLVTWNCFFGVFPGSSRLLSGIVFGSLPLGQAFVFNHRLTVWTFALAVQSWWTWRPGGVRLGPVVGWNVWHGSVYRLQRLLPTQIMYYYRGNPQNHRAFNIFNAFALFDPLKLGPI